MSIYRLICIPRTNSSRELAEIYTASDIFANPTYEDNYPTVNLEARACGTIVITYDTGGCEETMHDGELTVTDQGNIVETFPYANSSRDYSSITRSV